MYAALEGKVFSNVAEVIDAYETRSISLHNRIAIRATSIHKTFGDDLTKDSLPLDVKGKYLITTVGKVIFNEIFPDDFHYINDKPDANLASVESWFVPMGTDIPAFIKKQPLKNPIKKKDLGTIINQVFHKYDMVNPEDTEFRPSKTSAILDKIKDQGFKYSTVSSVTVSISDIRAISNKTEQVEKGQEKVDQITKLYRKGLLSNAERHREVVNAWTNVTEQVKNEVADASRSR
jgi:DNA-directed RNA polymerase subunit beta'